MIIKYFNNINKILIKMNATIFFNLVQNDILIHHNEFKDSECININNIEKIKDYESKKYFYRLHINNLGMYVSNNNKIELN